MGSLLAQVPGLTVYFLGVRPPTRVSQVGGQPHPITHLYRPAFGAGGQWRLVRAFSETTWAYPWGWLLSSLPKSWMTKYRLELAPFSYKLSFLDFVACWGMILVLGWPGGHLQTVTCLWIIVRVWYIHMRMLLGSSWIDKVGESKFCRPDIYLIWGSLQSYSTNCWWHLLGGRRVWWVSRYKLRFLLCQI